MDIIEAHKRCIHNWSELTVSAKCGCFYCLEIYSPNEVAEWTDDDDTAICPRCGIDAVIGDASGFSVTTEFMGRMHRRWFENEV